MSTQVDGRTVSGALAVGLLVLPLLVACGDGSGRGTSPSAEATPSPAATSPDAGEPDAATVLEGYGLALPSDAQDVVVEERPDDESGTERYLVTFTAPADGVGTMCADAGVNGPLPAGSLLPAELTLFEVEQTPEGARVCSGSAEDVSRQVRVLSAGDPADVRVALYTMPGR